MFGIGLAEICIILVIAVLVIGPKQIPEAAEALGKFVRTIRQFFNEFKREAHQHPYGEQAYSPKVKEVHQLPENAPEGWVVPELIDDFDEDEELPEKSQKTPSKKMKKSHAKKKKKVTAKKINKRKLNAPEIKEDTAAQMFLLPDDGPFGSGTDMENEPDLFTHVRQAAQSGKKE